MTRHIFAFLILCSTAYGQGVLFPNGGARERIAQIDGQGRVYTQHPDSNVSQLLYNLPSDDSGKFHISIFTLPYCEQSKLLVRDMKSDPALAAIADWGNTFYIDSSLNSQLARITEFHVKETPTLIIFPPMNSKNFPYVEVFRIVGYNGQPENLARRIMTALQNFYAKYNPQRQSGPLNPGYIDQPWRPSPDNTFRPLSPGPVNPGPQVWPDIPSQPNADTPDWLDASKLRTNPAYPPYPEVIVVVDPQGLGERLAAVGLEKLAELARNYVRARFGFSGAKSRVVKLGTPECDPYPVLAIDTPALFITVDGRIVGHITRGVAEALEQFIQIPEGQIEYDPSINALSGILAEQGEKQSQILELIHTAYSKYGFSPTTIIAIGLGLIIIFAGTVFGVGKAVGGNVAKVVAANIDYNRDGMVSIKDLRDAFRDVITRGPGVFHDVPPGKDQGT